MARGENRTAFGWLGAITSVIFLFMFAGMGEMDAAPSCCFWLVVSIILIASGSEAKKKAMRQQVIYIPQVPVQQVVHHTYHQAPVVQQQRPAPVAKTTTHTAPAKSQAEWAMDARNLEMARDWDRAAQAYQKAGLYAEAGRIRQAHMEKEDSQVKINIDRVGDNIQDSVVMKDNDDRI